jgi:hypothetical protein
MAARGGGSRWETTLAVQALELNTLGKLTKVVVGVIAQNGVLHIAIRIGTETVLLPTGTATQLLTNLRRVIDHKLQAES